ncbi:hypothetical protein [Paenibacillus sp. NPDC058367]|uniref:hypothetical protein n=1 Tax=unclassified Paenibacillus TaxID=185978 RepID=UPI00365E3FF1
MFATWFAISYSGHSHFDWNSTKSSPELIIGNIEIGAITYFILVLAVLMELFVTRLKKKLMVKV